MTHRLYYTDSYSREFTGQVVETGSLDGRPSVLLDLSLFYPTSGGQPHDVGQLGPAEVVDVAVRDHDGEVVHFLDRTLDPGPVNGRIDWRRRFDHMQQHTGQHVLSQAFVRLHGAATIGFHLGADRVSIDLAIPALDDGQLADAESLANEVVNANAPVRAWFPAEEELSSLALRKLPTVEGPLRVVAIGDFDLSACGGTHVAASGEIGLISILRAERLKRGVRIEFLCGARARTDYSRKHAIVQQLAGSLTCSPSELRDSVARLQEALHASRRELAAHQERELDAEAARRLADAEERGGLRMVRSAWSDRPVEEVKGLALRLTSEGGVITLFGIAGARAQILFGRSENVIADLKPVFEQTLTALGGGRGGGARLLQGAAGRADLRDLERALLAAEQTLRESA